LVPAHGSWPLRFRRPVLVAGAGARQPAQLRRVGDREGCRHGRLGGAAIGLPQVSHANAFGPRRRVPGREETHMNNKKISALRVGAIAVALGLTTQLAVAETKDYLVTAARPDKVVVVDVSARKVHKTHQIPNTAQGNSVAGLTVSRDGKVAYMVHNRWETVSGIDLE